MECGERERAASCCNTSRCETNKKLSVSTVRPCLRLSCVFPVRMFHLQTSVQFHVYIFIVQETVIKHNQSHNSNIMTTCFGCLSSHLQVNNNELKTKHSEVYKAYNTIKTIETYLNKLMGSHVKYV
jgi:hypothetical protein